MPATRATAHESGYARSEPSGAPTSLRQLDDLIAIVNVDGKDMYFDPGQRYTAFGHLAWQHTITTGLRETADGTTFVSTPGEAMLAEKLLRKADLTLSREASGTVQMIYAGDSASLWRQDALRGDDTSLSR